MMVNNRKQKMMLVFPLLVVPFLTMAFWALGGGKGSADKSKDLIGGLNLKLPDSKLKEDKLLDKLSFYDKADKDSIKLAEDMRNDPYYKRADTAKPVPANNELERLTQTTASKYNQRLNVSPFDKPTAHPEQQVIDKLALLQKELANNSSNTDLKEKDMPASNSVTSQLSGQMDRLEDMMKGMGNGMSNGNPDDPEMKQISSMMDKILDIQHPELVKDRLKERTLKDSKEVFKVTGKDDDDTSVNGFYSIDNDENIMESNAIQAVVNENQVLVNGSVIKLRLLNDIYINGNRIQSGNFVYGIVSLNGERLEIEIPSIRSERNVYPVKMEVYDMDGLSGIFIPGAITRDVAKQSVDNGLQTMELTSLDPSLKAQATATGLNAAKSLLSKKVKIIKVMVKSGYKILLKNK